VKPLEMVVFSDFECPVCRKFTERLEKELIPFLDHRVALTWKHYPIDQACNPHAVRTLHEHACTAAFAAEAARMQGGNEAFWKAHDKLFADQRRIGEINFEVFAAELGLDPQRFVADMQSEAVKQRIREDAELAHKLQVTGTPAVYIMGRRVRNFLFESKAFLEDLKRSREQEHGAKPEHRPARPRKPEKQEAAPSPADADTTSALPAEPDSSPIPDNPGPPDAE
jgi:protein-disulfide isomerase